MLENKKHTLRSRITSHQRHQTLQQALQRYRRSADEQDDTFDMPPSGARWAEDKHRSYAVKGGKGPSHEPLVRLPVCVVRRAGLVYDDFGLSLFLYACGAC